MPSSGNTIETLRANLGRVVTLTIDDGEVVRVKLLALDAEHHEDVTVDVLEVIRPVAGVVYTNDRAYLVPLSTVASVTPADLAG